MKDILIASVTGYTPDKLENWVYSAKKHFKGDIVVIGYDIPSITVDFLKNQGVEVYGTKNIGLHIVVQRFFDIYNYLHNNPDYRFVICTDIKDVIFQRNPSEFLEKKLIDREDPKHILVGSEGIKYKDEEWNNNNLKVCYPYLHSLYQDTVVSNAGTFAGKLDYIKDLCFNIFHLSLTAVNKDPQPDQTAFNILINSKTLKDITYFSRLDEPWCAQLGVAMHPTVVEKYKGKMVHKLPIEHNNKIITPYKEEYYLVHQYDRIDNLKIDF